MPVPAEPSGDDTTATLADQVRGALTGLDDLDLDAHAEVFEALNDAILAELRRVERL